MADLRQQKRSISHSIKRKPSHADKRRTTPILALDLWEHAYYDQYQSNKADYIDAWWQLIDWESVSDLWQEATNPTAEESAYTLAQKLKPQTSPTPYGCKSSVEATPAGRNAITCNKHLNTFSNPCGGKSHSSNNYYSAKSRAAPQKETLEKIP